jgi:integrase
MRHEHIKDGWWEMPGDPVPTVGWPGTKNGAAHRVWLSRAALSLVAEVAEEGARTGFVLAGPRGAPVRGLDAAMRTICRHLQIELVTPHDLRRTHGTTIAALGFGRDAMNRSRTTRRAASDRLMIGTAMPTKTSALWKRWHSISSRWPTAAQPTATSFRSARASHDDSGAQLSI